MNIISTLHFRNLIKDTKKNSHISVIPIYLLLNPESKILYKNSKYYIMYIVINGSSSMLSSWKMFLRNRVKYGMHDL